MTGAQTPGAMSPKLLKVVQRAKRDPEVCFNSLAHLLDVDALRRAYDRIRKDAAIGVDAITKEEYGRERIADTSLLRLIGECLHVGILDGERYSKPDEGTVQGSVLSPMLGNVYLHHVLDRPLTAMDGRPAIGRTA